MKNLRIAIILLALLPIARCAMASQDGDGTGETVLTGSVSDALSKKPMKGVTISITSSKDKIGKCCFTTDDSGRFIIPRLPAGEVTIILEKKGYKTYRREKIVIREGRQVKLNFDMSNEEKEGQGINLFHPLLHMLQS